MANPQKQNGLQGEDGRPPDRTSYSAFDVVEEIWKGLQLPEETLKSLSLTGEGLGLPSSFKIGLLAQSTIALSALTAALVSSLRGRTAITPSVMVLRKAAAVEFKSERLYVLDGKLTPSAWGPIGGLHKTSDGYVRIHDSFPNHRDGALRLLGLPLDAKRDEITKRTQDWASIDLEITGVENRIVIAALRSYKQWDCLPQAKAIKNFPILIRPIATGHKGLPQRLHAASESDGCLRGLRVVELSRVIAAPLAGRTLAAHGADVLWVTSPNLPDLPTIDRDFGRGKRSIQLDIHNQDDRLKLLQLLETCDVFIQGFRPGSLASYGLSPEELAKKNPNIICANMSAYGPDGPWSYRRGFDSIIQTCSGMNVSEAEHFDQGEPARPTPCQALDHGGGYLLAAGICAAIYRRAIRGGSYTVDVSLAGVMKYLRSLGQYPGKTGFDCPDFNSPDEVKEFLETKMTGFGTLTAVKHSATIEGRRVGWDIMPKPLGSDRTEWLQ